VEGVRQKRHLGRVTIAMHGCAERGRVVHAYQQLAVTEDIAEGHDRSDNSEELSLVDLVLFRVPKLSIYARMSSGTSQPRI